ncbi:MAG: CRTAC1 family protein [Thermoplasmata archaeon]|nr:CRTAC1 family protein [Thermoplasmata archaeon]
MSHKRIALLLCAVLVLGIVLHVGPKDSLIERTRSDENPIALDGVTFTDVALDVGLDGVGGNFFAWGDYDNDGYEDLLVSGRRLFRNNGPPGWNFTETTSDAALSDSPWVGGGMWGDFDDDGFLDIYATVSPSINILPSCDWEIVHPYWDILWHNNGNGTFTNVTEIAGTYDIDKTGAAAWGDYDGDGLLDLYVAGSELFYECPPGSYRMYFFQDHLYHNDGGLNFTEVTDAAGMGVTAVSPHYGRGVTWADYDGDGDQDIYVSNYRLHPNYLWENNGNGTFTDVAPAKNVTGWETSNYYGHTIGSSWADMDNDGDLDLFTANLAHKDPFRGPICDDSRLYENSGPPSYDFADIRQQVDLPVTPVGTVHSSGYYYDELFSNAAWADYDNDGDLDVWVPQVYGFLAFGHSFLFKNNLSESGSLFFENATGQAGVMVWGTYGGAWADYDNDGNLDLVTGGQSGQNAGDGRLRLYRNDGNNNTWLKIKLIGCDGNRFGVGAKVYVSNGTLTQLRQVETGMGSHSQMNSLAVEFGFGSFTGSVNVTVVWPNGEVESIEDIGLNQTVHVADPSCSAATPTSFSVSLEGPQMNDVRVSWNLSEDDGAGKNNVVSYLIYYSSTYDKDGEGYQPLAEIPSGTDYFVHSLAGNGDANSYFYYIGVKYTVGEPIPSETFVDIDSSQIAKYGRYLPAGKHFVSIPIVPDNPSTESVFATLTYDMIAFWDRLDHANHWKHYWTKKLYDRDLPTVEPGRGYWINVTSDSYVEFIGRVPENISVMLYKGWNMIGYGSYVNRSVEAAFQGLSVLRIEGFDRTASPYGLRKVDMTDTMIVGGAYWVRVSEKSLWTVEN